MFDNLFGTEAGPVVNYVFAFVLVIILILVVAWVVRRFFMRGDFHLGPRTGQRRLAVVEASGVDAQRRLILVRRDDVEHLLLIGGTTDIVVEANIGAAQAPAGLAPRREVRAPAPSAAMPSAPPPGQAAPQPGPAPVQPPRPRPASPGVAPQPPAPSMAQRPPMQSRPPQGATPVEPRPEHRLDQRPEPRPDPLFRNTPTPERAEPAAPRRYSFETPAEKDTALSERPIFPDRGERGGDR